MEVAILRTQAHEGKNQSRPSSSNLFDPVRHPANPTVQLSASSSSR